MDCKMGALFLHGPFQRKTLRTSGVAFWRMDERYFKEIFLPVSQSSPPLQKQPETLALCWAASPPPPPDGIFTPAVYELVIGLCARDHLRLASAVLGLWKLFPDSPEPADLTSSSSICRCEKAGFLSQSSAKFWFGHRRKEILRIHGELFRATERWFISRSTYSLILMIFRF